MIWAAELIGKFTVRPSGRTAYVEITGHRCKHDVALFAETVHFKMAIDKNNRNKAETDWQTGFFVGVSAGSTEILIINQAGMSKCGTLKA